MVMKRISTVSHLNSRSSSSGMGLRSCSAENLKKLDVCLNNMDGDVTNLFIKYNMDPELLSLLNQYFTTSKGVSELCESLRKFLERPEVVKECCLIDKALRDFHEERLLPDEKASFTKTLQDLSELCNCKFELSGKFVKKTQIFQEELSNMIVKLEKIIKKIDKKLKRVRGVRAIVAVGLVASGIALSVTGLFGSVPTEALAKFAALKWRKSTEALKREKTAMSCMERATIVVLKEMEKISKLVIRMEKAERLIRGIAESAVKRETTVAAAMGGVEKEGKKLKSTVVDIKKERERCDDFEKVGRSVAQEKVDDYFKSI